jgi:hypothetical protein
MAAHAIGGSAAARALKAHFARVTRSELSRLARKLRTLSAEERATAERVIADVVGALTAGPTRVLAAQPEPLIVNTVVHLFGLNPDDVA